MTRETLDRNIQNIREEILMLSSMVEQAMHKSASLFRSRDMVTARKVMSEDVEINGKRNAIESAVMIVMATQQPMAHDLTAAGRHP